MRAILRRRYGGPEVLTLEEVEPPTPAADQVLTLEEVEPPTPAADQVLIRVHAASVNAYDWHLLRGKPYVARPGEGLLRPRDPAMGVDLAGVVEAIGPEVRGLAVGDRVAGGRTGAFRELIAARSVVRIPDQLSFEAAAASPMAGLTALQALRDKAGLRAGEHVLVAGAGGGVGTFAVQIARALGAGRVTATTSGPTKTALLHSLGADDVVDHRTEDATRSVRDVDVVIDVGGHGRLSAWRRTLTATGRIVLVGPGRGEWLGPINRVVTAAVGSRFRRQKALPFLSHTTTDDLDALVALLGSGQVRSVIDRVHPLEETAAAIAHVESGAVAGKVVIAVA